MEYAQLIDGLIKHRVLAGEEHDDLLMGELTSNLVRGEDGESGRDFEYDTGGGGGALRAAESMRDYPSVSGAPPQTELLEPPQNDLFSQ